RPILLMDGSRFRFEVANNPHALGYAFPYPQVVGPVGWQFIFSMPGQWLWLIGQRALYLFGIKRDIWALPPQGFGSGPIGSLSVVDLIGAIVLAVGIFFAANGIRRRNLKQESLIAMLLLGCVILPALLLFGSKRFLVPVVPLMALFQAF